MGRDDDRLRPEGQPGRGLPRRADLIYRYMRRRGNLLIEEIADGVGMSIDRVTLEVRFLVNEGLVEHVGGGRYAAL